MLDRIILSDEDATRVADLLSEAAAIYIAYGDGSEYSPGESSCFDIRFTGVAESAFMRVHRAAFPDKWIRNDPTPRDRTHIERERARMTRRYREQIYDRDGRICAGCAATDDLQIDHIIPVSKGGTSDVDNLQVLCRPCNVAKGVS